MNVKALVLFFVAFVDLFALAVALHWFLWEAETPRPSNERVRSDRLTVPVARISSRTSG